LKLRNRRDQPGDVSLEKHALALVKRGTMSVGQLYDALKSQDSTVDPICVTELVWRLVEEGIIDLEDTPPRSDSLRQYLRIWDENLWLYVSLGVALAASLSAYALPVNSALVVLRWVLGVAFVLLIPGFVATQMLFPNRNDLGRFMRVALSIGLSLVLVMIVGVLLNFTPWGITTTPILISLTILTVSCTLVALFRKYWLSANRSQSEP
jgi:hypothetical protein